MAAPVKGKGMLALVLGSSKGGAKASAGKPMSKGEPDADEYASEPVNEGMRAAAESLMSALGVTGDTDAVAMALKDFVENC